MEDAFTQLQDAVVDVVTNPFAIVITPLLFLAILSISLVLWVVAVLAYVLSMGNQIVGLLALATGLLMIIAFHSAPLIAFASGMMHGWLMGRHNGFSIALVKAATSQAANGLLLFTGFMFPPAFAFTASFPAMLAIFVFTAHTWGVTTTVTATAIPNPLQFILNSFALFLPISAPVTVVATAFIANVVMSYVAAVLGSSIGAILVRAVSGAPPNPRVASAPIEE